MLEYRRSNGIIIVPSVLSAPRLSPCLSRYQLKLRFSFCSFRLTFCASAEETATSAIRRNNAMRFIDCVFLIINLMFVVYFSNVYSRNIVWVICSPATRRVMGRNELTLGSALRLSIRR